MITQRQIFAAIYEYCLLDGGYEIKRSFKPRFYEQSFSDCVEKPANFRNFTGFEPSNQLSHEAP